MAGFKGLDRLVRKLDALGGNSDKAVARGIASGVLKVQGDAKSLCPVDDGLLRNSIHADVKKNDGQIVGKVSTNVHYAPYVEFGTGQRGEGSPAPPKYDGELAYRQDWKGMPAQPFLFPAIKQNEGYVRQAVTDSVQREINKITGGGS